MVKISKILNDDSRNIKIKSAFDYIISAQMIQIVELYTKGYELFEDRENFQKWMDVEIVGLGSVKPKSLLDTTFGIQMVVHELGRLEYGIIS